MEIEERIKYLSHNLSEIKERQQMIAEVLTDLLVYLHSDIEHRKSELHDYKEIPTKVYMIIEFCGCDETRNIACLKTEEEAIAFCEKHNPKNSLGFTVRQFTYEDWRIGEIIENFK